VTLLVEQQEGHPVRRKTGRWFVGGDDLTATSSSYSCRHRLHYP